MYQFVNYGLYLASTYGSGDYNTTTYNGQSTTSSSSLANTGFIVLAVVTVAAVIIFVALLVRFIRRKPSKPNAGDATGTNTTPPASTTPKPPLVQ